jgi:hypothetical protein
MHMPENRHRIADQCHIGRRYRPKFDVQQVDGSDVVKIYENKESGTIKMPTALSERNVQLQR